MSQSKAKPKESRRLGARHTSASASLRLPIAEQLHHYHRYLFSQIRPYLKGSVCEIGSGTGLVTQYMADYEKVTAVEPDGACHVTAMQRFAYQLNVACVQCDLRDCPNEKVPRGAFDSVVCLNLLEQFEDAVGALEIMGELAVEGGHIIVVLPAGRALDSARTPTRGGLRRARRESLQEAFNRADLVVTRSGYFNFVGLVASWFYRRIMRGGEISVATAKRCDRFIPLIHTLERIWQPPVGLSLLMVGRRP